MSLSSSSNKGFTLTEVLVTLSIMLVMLSVVLFNQSTYTEKVALSNLADQISLSLSQAQTYGIAVREFTPGSEDFSIAYGMSFSMLPSASPSSYIFFADRNANGAYDGDWTCPVGGASECLEKVDMRQGNLINSICVIEEDGTEDCSTPRRVDISFVRPKTEAQMTVFNAGGASIDTSTAQGVKVQLRSPNSFERLVVVYKVGQISALEPVYDYQYPAPAYNYPSPQAYLTPYAYQTPVTYRDLTVTKLGTGSGTVTGAGINCGSTCTGAFASGAQVTLTATPDNSTSIFSGWSGNCSGTGSCVLTMDASKIARATFTKIGPTVTSFNITPNPTLASLTASFTATDATAGAYLTSADLRRAPKTGTCTTNNVSGCSWSTVATSRASNLATFTSLVGVSASGNSLTKTGADGWTNGAISNETIASGDGFVEFSALSTGYHAMGGLGSGNTDQNYNDIEYAIYPANGSIYIYESGNQRGASYGTYTATDVFKVAIESGVVKYYKNGALFYTSTVAPTGYPYRFDSSLWGYGAAAITNVKISSNTLDSWTGNMSDTPSQGSYYIYDLNVSNNASPTAQTASSSSKIEVGAGDFTAPLVTAFDVQPRSNASTVTATFTATDSGGSYLDRAELMRATKNANCTVAIDSGCTWSVVATSKASNLSTFTGVSGVTVSGNSLINSGGSGWDAGAASIETIPSGDGFVEFSTNENNVYKMGGLGTGNTNQHYSDIEYAIYPTAFGSLQVWEGGSQVQGNIGTYVAGDLFKVAIESGVVKYYKNNTVIYSHATTPTYPLRFDSSFYPGGSLTNIKVSSNTLNSWTGNMVDSPSAGTYIYGLKVYDKNPSGSNMGSEPARIEVAVVGPNVSSGASTVVRGQNIVLNWDGILPAGTNDWVGLYPSGAPDSGGYISWVYTSSTAPPCGTTLGSTGKSSGSCSFTVPASATPGAYNFRLFANGITPLVPVSSNFTVTGGQLTTSHSTIVRGNTMTASWQGIWPITNVDWIGLYPVGAVDQGGYVDWIYANSTTNPCYRTASASGSSAGSCQYVVPASVAAGTYELRMFANNGYSAKLATSPTFTVTAP